jgi:plasmid stability protein
VARQLFKAQMANLIISLDKSTIRSACIRAISEGTSLSAKMRDFLSAYVEGADAQGAQARQAST